MSSPTMTQETPLTYDSAVGSELAQALLKGGHQLRIKERIIHALLLFAAASSVIITLGIIGVLLYESLVFFSEVSVKDFLTDKQWTPLFEDKHYGIQPLLVGTLVTTIIALFVAIPVGTISAIWLSEYAPGRMREIIKPALELLGAVPTVVYGYFAFLVVTPFLQWAFAKVGVELPKFNMLSAGLVMGLMIVPYISSLSEDAMHAVPKFMREGSYAMGATKMQTAWRVIVPSSFSGITAAYILGISRAVGETMVVTLAAGSQPNLTWNPTEGAATITAFIVQVSGGDIDHGDIGYKSIFAAGLMLMCMTFLFNIGGYILRKRYREAY
jgi:phosphate transport system permease protein